MSTSTPKPPSGRTWLLLLGATTLFVGVAFAIAYRAKVVGIRAIEQGFADRGLGVTIGRARLSLGANVVLDSLCVSVNHDAHDDVCASGLAIGLNRRALLRRSVEVRTVHADAVTINSSTERLERFFETVDNEGDGQSPGGSRLSALREISVDRASVSFLHDDTTLHVLLDEIALTHTPKDDDATPWRAAYNATLERFDTADGTVAHLLGGMANTSLHVEVAASTPRDIQSASARFDAPVVLTTDVGPRATVRLQQIRFEAPYAVFVDAPAIQLVDRGIAADAASVRLDVGQWTTHLPDLYIAAARAETPNVYLTDKALRPLPPSLQALFGTQGEAATPVSDAADGRSDVQDDVQDSAQDSARDETASAASQWAEAFGERTWWEVLPREITVHNGRIAVVESLPALGPEGLSTAADLARIEARGLEAHYGIRVIQRQMDVELAAQMQRRGQPAGAFRAKFEWQYDKKRAHLDAGLDEVPLAWLASAIAPTLSNVEGTLNASITLHGSSRAGFEAETRLALQHVLVPHPKLLEPLRFTSIESEATVSLLPNERDGWDIGMPTHRVRVGDAVVHPRVDVHGLGTRGTHLFETAEIHLEVPPQEAMVLFDAIPRSLRGPVADAKMRGQWGLDLVFSIEARDVNAEGLPLWEIMTPTQATIHDGTLALISLPEAVDVRRMNGPMRIVFRGPNDSMMRPLTVPGPRNRRSYPTITSTDGEDAGGRWLRLSDFSYYLLATQLYREDGSFFRNSGINWLQARRVLSEALTTGSLSRGASTITMQTVKNLFLSHERSIERKLQELFLSYWMTRAVPKERILEIYMNIIELGPNINGFEEASRFYFGQSAATLGLRESVWLSSISPNPGRIGGATYRGSIAVGACVRCDRLIEALHARQWISDEEHRAGLGNGAASPGGASFDENAGDGWAAELPPLFAAIEEGPRGTAVRDLATDARIPWWINQSTSPRGVGAQP